MAGNRRAVIVVVLAGALALPATAGATPPIWEPNVGPTVAGNNVTDADDAATAVPLGTFAFPFYGVAHTGAETFAVSSNGLLEIGPVRPESSDNSPTGNEARLGPPKIAALWADYNPAIVVPNPDGGSVFMNTFNDDGDGAIDRVVFTWDSVLFGCEAAPLRETCRATVQTQLLESGRIIFGYNGVLLNQDRDNFGGSPLMPVITQGGFPAQPGFNPDATGVDFSETVPFSGGGLIYEEFRGRPVHFDLDQSNLIFDPVDGATYAVSSPVDIAVTSSASTSNAQVGQTVTFTSKVTNTGSQPVSGVGLSERLPDGATGSATATAGGCLGGGPVNCAIGDLAPGASATVTTTATMGQAGPAIHRVEVSTATPGDGGGNNRAVNLLTVGEDATPPVSKVKAPKQSIADALAKGVVLNVTCSEACLAEAKLTGSAKGKKKSTVGTGTAELNAAGTTKLKVQLTKAARRALGPANKAKYKATVKTTDENGNTSTAKTTVKLS